MRKMLVGCASPMNCLHIPAGFLRWPVPEEFGLRWRTREIVTSGSQSGFWLSWLQGIYFAEIFKFACLAEPETSGQGLLDFFQAFWR